ncbi:hypothetical protein [Haloechinothrix halophila]|nr:hypothetical protein [Haloechinothrix halophila]
MGGAPVAEDAREYGADVVRGPLDDVGARPDLVALNANVEQKEVRP